MIAVICIRPEVLSINVLGEIGLWQLIVILRVGCVLLKLSAKGQKEYIVLASILQSSVDPR